MRLHYKDNYNYLACFIIIILASLHFLSAYPGGMAFDSYMQFKESLDRQYYDWHPPIMAQVWTIFNFIWKGPQLMLAKNILFLWIGMGIFYLSLRNSNPKLSLLYLILPLTPGILLDSSMVLKDSDLGVSLFLSAAILSYFASTKQKPSTAACLIVFILIFYGTGVKFQGKFIAPIMVSWLMLLIYKSNMKRLILASLLGSVFVICGNVLLIEKFSNKAYAANSRIFFDLAGTSVNENTDLFPDFLKTNPKFSFEKVKKFYTPKLVDPLRGNQAYVGPANSEEIRDFELTFYYNAIKFPFSYLKHRAENHKFLLFECRVCYGYAANDGMTIYGPEYQVKNSSFKLKEIVKDYIDSTRWMLDRNYVYFFIMIIQVIYLLLFYTKDKFLHNVRFQTLIFLNLISVFYEITLFFTTQASDCRYFYIIKLFSTASIPIMVSILSKHAVYMSQRLLSRLIGKGQ